MFYWFVINVQSDHRLSLHNIQLATIAFEKDIKTYGAELVISQGDEDGGFKQSTSFGASMHRMNRGAIIKVPNPLRQSAEPDDDTPPFARLLVQGWCPLLIADTPASSAMLSMKVRLRGGVKG